MIDTPGIGEDLIRDEISKREAKLAHAAVLVLNATQLGSLNEVNLVSQMTDKLRGLLILINKVDLTPENEWPSFIDHVLNIFEEIEKDQIILSSATEIIKEQKQGLKEGNWLNVLKDFKEKLKKRIILNTASIKIGYIISILNDLKSDLNRMINDQISKKVKR